MRKLLTITFLIIISFECKCLLAQKLNITFEHFSVEQGLPSTVVPCLFQDRTGYLWFGTFYGIARYDGYSIVSYTNREADTTSITNSIVNAICDDREGNIWFGHSRGLDKFNPSTEKFTHYILNPEMPLTDWSQHVLSLHEDKDGMFWIGTGGGLYVFNKFTETFTCFKHDSTNPYSISSNSINSIIEDRSGTLWFATGKGFNKFDKVRKQFFHYWLPSEKEVKNGENHGVISILEDRDGIFWLGTGGGLAEFNIQTETVTVFKHDPKDPLSLANNIVKSICEDRSGQLWISTKDGVDLFNKKTKIFSHYKHDELKPGSLGSNDVGKIILDRSGAIWVSTYGGGVNKYTPPNQFYKRYLPEDGKGNRSPSASFIEDKNGTIWMNTVHGLLKFNPEKETFKRLVPDKDIYLVMEDTSGTIWYIAWNESLSKINKNDQVSYFKDSKGLEFPEFVTAMCNSFDGNIWVGTGGGNVYSLNPATRKVTFLFQESNWIESICEDNNGLLWIGIREAGILCYDPQKKKSFYHTFNPRDSSTISNNNIGRIIKDKTGDLLIIAGRTLNKYDQTAHRFIRLGEKMGFPVNIIQVTEDEKGSIWMGTLKGAVKYNSATHQFRNYSNIRGRGYKTKSGELYFVGLSKDGITRFHPDSVKDNSYIPRIVITSFRMFEKPYPFGKEIHLSYNENFLSFEFAALSYIDPERNLYAYKMEGVNKDWVYSGTRRFASYPNLEPGEYIFRVKGSNNDGVWNEDGTSITIIISPPWWKTSWAFTSYVLIFVFSLYVIRRYEMSRLSLKNQIKMDEAVLNEKEETEKIKSRFFANISHEFRTPLTLILGPAEKISSRTSEDVVKDANIIKRNSRRLLQLINQLLDLSKLEAGKLKLEASKGNIVSFVKGVALSFESLAESKDIHLKLFSEKDLIELYFDKEKMMKILTNLLSNAFKFTPEEGRIIVSMKETQQNSVEIKIRDTGIGIAQEELPKLFDRFYQVDSSFTKEHEGTGIGLALTKELVELHHGIIKVESNKVNPENGGTGFTEFIVELPLGRDHLKDEEILKSETKPDISEIHIDDEKYFITKEVKEELGGILSENKNIILVVEDNYDMREYIKDSLSGSYVVEEAVNGEQGVRKAEKIIPDLIISDMMMPKMDGTELVRILKNNEKTSHIPIILLTARSGQDSKIEGLETGADEYLIKPFDLKELQARIENLIKIRKKLQQKFQKLEYLFKRDGNKGKSLDEQFINRVMEVIEKHISEEEFSIEEFGSEVGMSRAQFHRKFKAITGKPASVFLRSVRLTRAKKMIEEQSGNISEIAFSVGFSSPSYFSKCFRDEFGYPPSDSVK